MATKALSADQHDMLHRRWPSDCCLCNAEEKIGSLKETLRDKFAAKAMQGLLITEGREVAHLRETFEGVGRRAFKMADAMIKAREQ